MVYNENNSLYENNVLNNMEKFMEKPYRVTYTAYGNNITLVICDYYTSNVNMAVLSNNNNFVLVINGKETELTPAIIQKCYELLSRYKPRKKQHKQESEKYKKTVTTEQTRDIYKMVDGLCNYNHVFTKSPRPQIVLLPNKVKLNKEDNILSVTNFEYRIGYPKIKKIIAQNLFNNGKKIAPIYLEPKQGEDGKYHLIINGNDFVFQTRDFAQYFGLLFDWRNFSPVTRRADSTMFIRYQDKVCRQR